VWLGVRLTMQKPRAGRNPGPFSFLFRCHQVEPPYTRAAMLNAIMLLLSPVGAWNRIAKSRAHPLAVFLLTLLPLLAGAVWVEGYGIARWGTHQGELSRILTVETSRIQKYQAAQAVLLIMTFIGGGFMIRVIAHSFHFFPSFQQSFTLAVYGWSPFLFVRILDAHPAIASWGCWILGAVFSVRALYHGVGIVLQPDQTKGFGMFLVASLLGTMLTGLTHFLAQAVLSGRILP